MSWEDILTGALGLLPAILQFVELIHPRKPGTPPQGAVKEGAAVNLAQTALVTAAAAGVIPVSAAQDVAAITDKVRSTVLQMQSQGKLGGLKNAPAGPSLVNSPRAVAVEPPLFVPAPIAAQETTPILDKSMTLSGSTSADKLTSGLNPPVNISKVLAK